MGKLPFRRVCLPLLTMSLSQKDLLNTIGKPLLDSISPPPHILLQLLSFAGCRLISMNAFPISSSHATLSSAVRFSLHHYLC